MKTDTIFYQLFQTFPNILFELLGQPPSEALDYKFDSQEVKELAFRFDGVFVPPEDALDKRIYFVEVQFQKTDDFYWDLFGEIYLCLKQYKPKQNWLAVAVFSKRSLDPGELVQFEELFASRRVRRVYLDELELTSSQSIGIGMVKLVVEAEETAGEQASLLISQAKQEIADEAIQEKVIELVEKVLVYKFPRLTRQELEAMFGLDELKQTQYFQDVAEEARQQGEQQGKLETIPLLLRLGLSVEQIAAELGLELEAVRRVAQEQSQG